MKLFIDDIRMPPDETWKVARSFTEAKNYIISNGCPNTISLDHDLGVDLIDSREMTGYDFVKWLIKMDMENKIKIPNDFKFKVHSVNPVGKKNIETILNNYLKFKKGEKK